MNIDQSFSATRRKQNLTNALMFAKVGLYTFPSDGKVPLIPRYNRADTSFTKEERDAVIAEYAEKHGNKPAHVGATNKPDVIKRLWRKCPDAVPSIACGPSKLVVIDADLKDSGPELIGKLFAEHGGVPEGVAINPTKSGGQHFVFRDPDGRFTNREGALHKRYGCNVRGTGGQFVGPGSIREDGATYGTQEDKQAFLRAIDNGKMPELPDYIVDLIGAAPEGANKTVTSTQEQAVVKQLQDADWGKFEDVFDPVLGDYDLDELKASNPEFAKLYDNPGSDHSNNRFLAARHLMRKWFDMPAPALSIFFSNWEGAGSYTDGKPNSGEYDDRQIAREWLKNKGLRRCSNGDEFEPVEEDGEDLGGGRVLVEVNLNNPAAMVEAVEDILIERNAEIFRRGPILVEVVTDKPLPGLNPAMPTAQLLPVNPERLAQLTGRLMNFRKYDGRARMHVSCVPPRDLMNHLLARGVRSKIRRIDTVVATPLVRPDGSVLYEPGYDPITEVYLVSDGLNLPSLAGSPSREDGLRALEFAGQLFSECAFADKRPGYPFTSGGLSAVLSIVIAGMARLLMSGIPMLTCRAATPGSGKSFIGRLIGIWLTGRDIPVSNVAVGSSGELDKRLNAALLGGTPMIHLDNCNGKLDSELLCQILTERTVAVRPLGLTEEVIVSGMPIVLANGNNVQVDDNLARRTLLVELDAGVEKPELRNFSLRPVEMLTKNRGAYVGAILTALQAYLGALSRGEAKPVQPKVGSFDGWSDYARSLLIWYGYADPVEAMAVAQEEDPEKAARSAIFRGLSQLFCTEPFTAGKIIERIEAAELDVLEEKPAEAAVCQSILENLRTLLPKQHRSPTTQWLGTVFRSWSPKVEAGLKFCRLDRNAANVTTYTVAPIRSL